MGGNMILNSTLVLYLKVRGNILEASTESLLV